MRKLFCLIVLLLLFSMTSVASSAPITPGTPAETAERQQAVQTALGKVTPTTVLRGATVLNVYTGRWQPYQDVVFAGKRIAFVGPVGSYTGKVDPKTIVNLAGYFIVPAFGEAHNHIESIHLTPDRAADPLLRHGTTWNAEAGHEAGNTFTTAQNNEFWYASAAVGSPLTVLWQPGSAVPPTPFEHTAAVNDYKTLLSAYAQNVATVGLDEVMDGPSWQDPKSFGYARMWEALAATWDSGRIVSGHLSRMYAPADYQAGAAAGLQNDHTLTLGAEALGKMEAGISLLLTPGNMLTNASYLYDIGGITDWSHVAYTTDDKAVNDIEDTGAMDEQARKLMALGIPPADVFRMGSFYPATMWHIEKDFGSVAPGRYADVLVLRGPDVKAVDIARVYAKGELWVQDGKLVKELPLVKWPTWATTGSMKVRELMPADFTIKAPAGKTTVTAAVLPQFWFQPEYQTATMTVTNGIVLPDPAQKLTEFCIVDRYNDLAQFRRLHVLEGCWPADAGYRHWLHGSPRPSQYSGYGQFSPSVDYRGESLAHHRGWLCARQG